MQFKMKKLKYIDKNQKKKINITYYPTIIMFIYAILILLALFLFLWHSDWRFVFLSFKCTFWWERLSFISHGTAEQAVSWFLY